MQSELRAQPSVRFRSMMIGLVPILLAAFIPASAQVLTSRVDGTIRDQSGAVLPGVSVTLTNVDTNASRGGGDE